MDRISENRFRNFMRQMVTSDYGDRGVLCEDEFGFYIEHRGRMDMQDRMTRLQDGDVVQVVEVVYRPGFQSAGPKKYKLKLVEEPIV